MAGPKLTHANALKAWNTAGKPGKAQSDPGFDEWVDAWFANAVKAGSFTERGTDTSATAYTEKGYNTAGSDVTGFRARAKQEGWSEDYDRWSEAQLVKWQEALDPGCPPGDPFRSYHDGSCVQKPIDSGGSRLPNGEENPAWREHVNQKRGGASGPGGPGKPPPPPKPVTFGKQLSYTGNPMQDMLIQMFNKRTDLNDPTKANIFGMGADRNVGGEGAAADTPMLAQTLAGGGLWRGSEDTFGGFRADKTNVGGAPKPRGGGRPRGGGGGAPAPPPPSPAEIAAPPGAQPASQMNQWKQNVPSKLGQMMEWKTRRPRR